MKSDFEDIFLETEQEALLIALVEESRKRSPSERDSFMIYYASGGARIYGLEDYPDPHTGDIDILADINLIVSRPVKNAYLSFDVSPLGFRYYEYLMQKRGEPAEHMEQTVRRYLDTSGFEERYPEAFAKWRQAEELLWSSDTAQQHTAVGHHCREAMQSFATSLVEDYQPATVESDPAKTINRISAVLDGMQDTTSSTLLTLTKAMLHYWRALNLLAQRQEHGGQKEGEPLTWEDSRRLVFQTAIVMTEIDRTLKDLNP